MIDEREQKINVEIKWVERHRWPQGDRSRDTIYVYVDYY